MHGLFSRLGNGGDDRRTAIKPERGGADIHKQDKGISNKGMEL